MNKDPDEYFFTSDLSLCSTLSLFAPIEFIDRTNPQKIEFAFKKNEELDKLINQYWRKELRIEPIAHFNQLKMLKSRLYEEGTK
ncbi:MAG TPA: DUF5659 domain-containing protein [Patescibacteria group bacterium]|nr:DUF5659 domain-containing protein [Patescibacteria group bacterium]